MLRTSLNVLSCALLLCSAESQSVRSSSTSPFTDEANTLRGAAERLPLMIGTAVRPYALSEAAYASTLSSQFNMVEPEDALKWEIVHPGPQRFDFSQADRIVEFAAKHRMKVRGHTLVWHQQNPPWLADSHYSSAELLRILENHIKTVVAQYRGKVFAWDVANEAFDELALGKLRSTLWFDQPGIGFANKGPDYLEQSFRWAHEADPSALLFYNDAGAEIVNAKSDAIYAMIRDFRHRGVPINGIGFQMHIHNLHPDVASISANIERFVRLGVQVHITELDVALPVNTTGEACFTDLAQQAEVYRQIVEACLAHPGCTAIQTWGFTDKYSWIGSHSHHTQGAALVFDKNYQPKPAYVAIRDALLSASNREAH